MVALFPPYCWETTFICSIECLEFKNTFVNVIYICIFSRRTLCSSAQTNRLFTLNCWIETDTLHWTPHQISSFQHCVALKIQWKYELPTKTSMEVGPMPAAVVSPFSLVLCSSWLLPLRPMLMLILCWTPDFLQYVTANRCLKINPEPCFICIWIFCHLNSWIVPLAHLHQSFLDLLIFNTWILRWWSSVEFQAWIILHWPSLHVTDSARPLYSMRRCVCVTPQWLALSLQFWKYV